MSTNLKDKKWACVFPSSLYDLIVPGWRDLQLRNWEGAEVTLVGLLPLPIPALPLPECPLPL